jgi:hypothetical protein
LSKKEILFDLISTCGSLSEDQNKKIIDDFFKNNMGILKINDFINFYNSNVHKPINDYAIYMFFRYMK